MIPARLSWPSQRNEVINLQTGVDENIASLQQNPGSLLEVANYMIAEGTTGGYQSIAGFERFDGRVLSSTLTTKIMTIENPDIAIVVDDIILGAAGSAVALGSSLIIEGTLQVEVRITSNNFVRGEDLTIGGIFLGIFKNTKTTKPTETFHAVYDNNRALIGTVGGEVECEGPVLGVTLYRIKVYAFRKKVGLNEVGMYEGTVNGWVEVDTSDNPLAFGVHDFKFTTYNFFATAGSDKIYWIDGVNQCRSFNGTRVDTIVNCGMVSLINPLTAEQDDNDACVQLSKLEEGWDNLIELNVTTPPVVKGNWLSVTVTDADLRTFFDTYGARMRFRDLDDDRWVYPVYVTAGGLDEVTVVFEADSIVSASDYNVFFYYDQDQPENTTNIAQPPVDVVVTVNTVLRRDFSTNQDRDVPINIIARENRLILAYAGGSLQFSELTRPTGWSGVNGAFEVGTGDEITNLVLGVGNALIVFNLSSILIVNGVAPPNITTEIFSPTSGAYVGTAKRLLGTVFFLDDRGVTTMEAVQDFGDFAANSISENFKTTLFENIDNLTTSIVSRDLNQYRLFFSTGLGIIVSFKGKELQGATFTQFPIAVTHTTEGPLSNKRNVLLFTTDTEEYANEEVDGYVYVMDSGTSFDSHPIITKMVTSYSHYGSPRAWKRFISAMIEGETSVDTIFDVKIDFDYGSRQLPRTETNFGLAGEVVGGSLYGTSEYGTAIYGSGPVLSSTPVYLTGFGTNASFKILTNLRFVEQHVMQNILVDYTLLSRRI